MSRIATYMDVKFWNEKGVDWLRKAKSSGLTGFIALGLNDNVLPIQAESKAKELGFKIIPFAFKNEIDKFRIVSEEIQQGQTCLFLNCNVSPEVFHVSGDSEVACCLSEVQVLALVESIANLQDRAKAIEQIQNNVVNKYKKTLSSKRILGSWDFWNNFVSFYGYSSSKQYFSHLNDDLAFNLYVSLADSISLEIFID